MSISEEQAECPLCMEPFDIDDISFYPCTCGYQICRFCWHRIRTNENGLCPACRKAYPENPAEFKPLTDDEVHKIKKDRRQKETQRKQKSAECRKHLANVRVVQKNLVFVVGLSPRLCDAEILRRHEYFGKFGKIHKVVINQSTSYVGSQGPSASAYVTYFRPEDALSAIRTVNNLSIDGRTLKASLGTTKYCSHFLKGTQCQKTDCMYLHDYGDEAASFTKEEIQQGKHLVYEQKLHDHFGVYTVSASVSPEPTNKNTSSKTKEQNSPDSGQLSPISSLLANASPVGQHSPPSSTPVASGDNGTSFPDAQVLVDRPPADPASSSALSSLSSSNDSTTSGYSSGALPVAGSSSQNAPPAFVSMALGVGGGSNGGENMSMFSECSYSVTGRRTENGGPSLCLPDESLPEHGLFTDTQSDAPSLVTTATTSNSVLANDWQNSLGLSTAANNVSTSDSLSQDDDLGFDPWDVSARALADLIEKEKASSYRPPQHIPAAPYPMSIPPAHLNSMHPFHRLKYLPPGFTPNGMPPNPAHMRPPPPVFQHMAALQHRSRMLSMMQSAVAAQSAAAAAGGGGQMAPGPPRMMPPQFQPNHHLAAARSLFSNPTDSTSGSSGLSDSAFFPRPPQQPSDVYNWRDWQENFKALLPNVNISFGTPPNSSFPGGNGSNSGRTLGQSNGFLPSQTSSSHHGLHHSSPSDKSWSSRSVPDLSWDPAIINTGDVTTADSFNDEVPPHWMASLHHLTEDNNHMVGGGGGLLGGPLYGQSPTSPQNTTSSWLPQQNSSSRLLPPGFGLSSPARPSAASDSQLFTEHQLSAS